MDKGTAFTTAISGVDYQFVTNEEIVMQTTVQLFTNFQMLVYMRAR